MKISWLEAVHWQNGRNEPTFHPRRSISTLFPGAKYCFPSKAHGNEMFRSRCKPIGYLRVTNGSSNVEIPVVFAEVAKLLEESKDGNELLLTDDIPSIATYGDWTKRVVQSAGTAAIIIVVLFAAVIVYDYVGRQSKSRVVSVPAGVLQVSPIRASINRGSFDQQSDYGIGGFANSPSPRFLRQRSRLSHQ